MRCSRKIICFSLAAALCLSALAAERQAAPEEAQSGSSARGKSAAKKPGSSQPESKPSESAAPARAADEEEKPLPKLSLPLPKGQDSKGVTIPYTDGSGKKTMVFRIGVGTRIDEEHVRMADLKIETFNEEGEHEMTIELPESQMNLTTRVISGEESVTIKRSDFQLTGKTMEFNTETKQGWIKGDVKMIIYDLTEDGTGTTGKKGGQGS